MLVVSLRSAVLFVGEISDWKMDLTNVSGRNLVMRQLTEPSFYWFL